MIATEPPASAGVGHAPRSKRTTSSATASRSTRSNGQDALSDRVTLNLIRRTLCSHQLNDKNRDAQAPIEDLLPPLTSRNDVDLQLYAFLAIILRDFVQSWYGKITTDEVFVAEIVHTIAHCTRALEQRFRKVDLESLLLDQIPDVLDKHITAYRTAHQSVLQRPVEAEPRQVYHSLCPLPYLSPVPSSDKDEDTLSLQQGNEAIYRQLLVQGVLTILLPTEDLENPCLTSLVEQIFSELIIGNVIAGKASQPWVLYEGICIVGKMFEDREKHKGEGTTKPQEDETAKVPRGTVHGFFLFLINIGIFFATSIRLLVSAFTVPSSLPPRFMPLSHKENAKGEPEVNDSPKVAVLAFGWWSCVSNLIELPSRMPWLSGLLSLMQYGAMSGPGQVGALDGAVDRLLSHHIRSLLSPAHHLPALLRTLRGVLFPNNSGPGKPTLAPPSSETELRALRRRAASAVWRMIPARLGRLYLGGRLYASRGQGQGQQGQGQGQGRDEVRQEDDNEEDMIDEVEGILTVLSDEYCNKHLMYGVLELVLVRLMPELAARGVEELWEERLGQGYFDDDNADNVTEGDDA